MGPQRILNTPAGQREPSWAAGCVSSLPTLVTSSLSARKDYILFHLEGKKLISELSPSSSLPLIYKDSWTQHRRESLKTETQVRVSFFPTVSLRSDHVRLMGTFLITSRDRLQTPRVQSKERSFTLMLLDNYFVIISFNCYLKVLSYRYRKGKGK